MYRLKLLSDAELERGAVIVYNKLGQNTEINLDNDLFGMTKNSICGICGQTKECTCHYGLISLPFPIVTNLIVEEKFLKLISLVCPYCSNIPISNAKDSLKYQQGERFSWIQSEVKRKCKNNINICPYCNNKFIFITPEEPYPNTKFYFIQEVSNKKIQLNPEYIYAVLNNISNQTCEYFGFNIQTSNPRFFMTKFITIIPNKLRIKTLETASSNITSLYHKITENIIPQLNTLKTTFGSKMIIDEGENAKNFNMFYAQLLAFHGLFLDMTKDTTTNACLTAIQKRDRKHVDKSSSMIGRLKSKDSSYFEKGIIGTRHQVSARTVLGGATDLHCFQIGFPQKYANKMGYYIPVYKENLELIKQLVANMSYIEKNDKSIIRVHRIYESSLNKITVIKPDRAVLIAQKIVPGDKIFISLLPGSLVMHCRFPSVREESWATHELIPTSHTIMTLPLAACHYKNADFDGDETGIYVNHSWYTDAESLLLNSLYRQMLEYKNGGIGVFFDTDSNFEIPRIKAGIDIGIREVHDETTDKVIKRVSFYPPKPILSVVKEYLDIITGQTGNKFTKIEKINYEDASTKIVDNVVDESKCNLKNTKFYMYLATTIGTERTMNLIDKLVQLGYNLGSYNPITLGREIRFYDSKEEIKKEHEKTYYEMMEIEQSDLPLSEKDAKEYVLADKSKAKILPILTNKIPSSSNLKQAGLLPKFNNEFYASMVNMAPIIIDGTRIRPNLADHTRTTSAFSRFSIDPCSYGYIRHGYMNANILPTDTFYDCMKQRRSLYDKGNSVGEQGYAAKRFNMAFGPNVIGNNGEVSYENVYVSPCYGNIGSNPRYSFDLPLIDIDEKDFEQKYKEDKRLIEIRKIILSARNKYFNISDFVTNEIQTDKFNCGYNFEQYFKHCKEGKTDNKIIEELIEEIKNSYSPEGSIQRYNLINLIYFEYYLRTKLRTVNLTRDEAIDVYYKFINSLADSGEPVGLKASLAVSEGLTQCMLDAIHHATGGSVNVDKLKRTREGDRFDELLGPATHKDVVITLGFYDGSKENVERFAKEQETIYFKNIWSKLEICMGCGVSKEVAKIHPKIKFDRVNVSNTFIKIMLNLNILADYDIKLSELFNKLISTFDKIEFITGKIMNAKEFMAYIYFKPETMKIEIDEYIQKWKSEVRENIIHGQYLINCFVTQNKYTGEYILQANEVNEKMKSFNQIIFNPLLDPSKCHTTDVDTNLEIYGACESAPRLYEETIYCSDYLSSIGNILKRHYKTICLGCVLSSKYFIAAANSAFKIDGDYLRRISFEQPSKFIKAAIDNGKWKNIDDTVSAQMFGEIPKLGSGYSKIRVYKV